MSFGVFAKISRFIMKMKSYTGIYPLAELKIKHKMFIDDKAVVIDQEKEIDLAEECEDDY
jgi:hypothetical protein